MYIAIHFKVTKSKARKQAMFIHTIYDCAHCNDTLLTVRFYIQTKHMQSRNGNGKICLQLTFPLLCRRLICRSSFQVILVTISVPSSRHVPELDEFYDNL